MLQTRASIRTYRFRDTDDDDIANCSNTLALADPALLRRGQRRPRRWRIPDAERIYSRNIETLRALGWEAGIRSGAVSVNLPATTRINRLLGQHRRTTMIRNNAMAAALLLASGSAFGWGDGCDVSAERSLELDGNGIAMLELIARAGDLRIEGSDQAGIVVHGKACASSQQLLDSIQLTQRRSGDRQTIEAVMPEICGWVQRAGHRSTWLSRARAAGAEAAGQLGRCRHPRHRGARRHDSSGDLRVARATSRATSRYRQLRRSEVHGIGGDVPCVSTAPET